ncbi:MAG: PaaI family thioesterase [Candidatus Aminicenantes bacterium]|nr:PaaI family thioesterase [Candidatus Aminicenantes bacterium]
MKDFNDNNRCFVCGPANPNGLKLSFQNNEEKDRVEAEICFPAHLQGWGNVVHGGLVSTVLDEIMIKAAHAKKFKCVTGEITVKFKKPTFTEKKYFVSGKVTEARSRLVMTEATITDEEGNITARSSGKLFTVS